MACYALRLNNELMVWSTSTRGSQLKTHSECPWRSLMHNLCYWRLSIVLAGSWLFVNIAETEFRCSLRTDLTDGNRHEHVLRQWVVTTEDTFIVHYPRTVLVCGCSTLKVERIGVTFLAVDRRRASTPQNWQVRRDCVLVVLASNRCKMYCVPLYHITALLKLWLGRSLDWNVLPL